MVTKRKPPARRRKPATKAKKQRRIWAPIMLSLVFLGMVAVAGWMFLSKKGDTYTDMTDSWVQTVLLAADVDLDRQVQVVDRDDTERWKITLHNEQKKDAILRALEQGLKDRGQTAAPVETLRRNGRNYYIVSLDKENGDTLRLIFEVKRPQPPRAKPTPAVAATPKAPTPAPAATATPDQGAVTVPVEAADTVPRIAVILDDIGHESVESLRPVLDLKFPVTFAVLPFLAHSRSCAYYLHQNQYEVMLHMPMEPESYPKANPGEGAILAHHNDTEIRAALNKALDAVPFVSGVNNHMGSRITASRNLMRPVLDELKTRGLFYIDSRTQSNTIAFKMARDMGLRTSRRDVFLDSEQSYDFALKQLEEARRVADEQGFAVVIGHPYGSSLKALKDAMPQLDKDGYRFVFASDLVHNYHDQL